MKIKKSQRVHQLGSQHEVRLHMHALRALKLKSLSKPVDVFKLCAQLSEQP